MLDQLDANFRKLSHADIIIKVGGIADTLANHSGFPLPWPDVVPEPQRLKEMVIDFTTAVNAAANGDRQRIADRDVDRAELEMSAGIVAQYLVMKSLKEKDLSLLNNTGFKLKKRANNRVARSANVGAPINFSVKRGTDSGSVVAKSNRVPGGATSELQSCQGDPTIEESWKTLGQFVLCSHMEVHGLEAGQRYNFRLRSIGVKGPGPWSSIVSLMIV